MMEKENIHWEIFIHGEYFSEKAHQCNGTVQSPPLEKVFKVANSWRRSLESPSEKLSDVEDCQCAEEKVQTSQPAKLGHQTGSGRILQAQTYAFVIIIIILKDTINHILIKSKNVGPLAKVIGSNMCQTE